MVNKMVENVAEIRSIQNELMSKITIAEYRTLRWLLQPDSSNSAPVDGVHSEIGNL